MKWLNDLVDNATTPNDGDLSIAERPPEVAKREEDAPTKPPMYAIILHNDNSTFPDFVIQVIVACFGLNQSDAARVMQKAHFGGKMLVKTVSREIAETEVGKANDMAKTGEYGKHFGRGTVCELTFSFEPETPES